MIHRLITTKNELRDATAALLALPDKSLPLVLSFCKYRKRHTEQQNRMLNAHIRDIARWIYKDMKVPERVFEGVLYKLKLNVIWPRYSDPEPNEFTGETVYLPKSRRDLTSDELKRLVEWLEKFMAEHEVPSHAPVDRWTS